MAFLRFARAARSFCRHCCFFTKLTWAFLFICIYAVFWLGLLGRTLIKIINNCNYASGRRFEWVEKGTQIFNLLLIWLAIILAETNGVMIIKISVNFLATESVFSLFLSLFAINKYLNNSFLMRLYFLLNMTASCRMNKGWMM